jgi:hypothetical protein
MILRMLPGSDQEQNRDDAYQSVCEALLKNDLQRLRAYSGRGSPSGFILHVMENLIIDYVRTIVPRRRLPTAIARLAALDQSIFRLLYWERLAPDPVLLLVHLPREKAPPTAAVVAEAGPHRGSQAVLRQLKHQGMICPRIRPGRGEAEPMLTHSHHQEQQSA